MLTVLAYLLLAIFLFSTAVLVLRIGFVPLALFHELLAWRRRRSGNHGVLHRSPAISVVVPAHNEEAVLVSCVRSILGSNRENLEVLIIDDGSTDRTGELGRDLESEDPRVRYLHQNNAGKGAALNHGYRESTGEFLMFVDADSVFTDRTVPEMLRAFHDDRVGAVCGDDRPVNLNRVLTRFLALITHVGTGLVRRAFDVLRCVPVVSGNCGAFRRSALDELAVGGPGPLREDTIGEDLELTWRMHRTSWRVVFAPRALVYAESPSSIRALWRQRVRWARGLLQGVRYHWGATVIPRYGTFTPFLWFTVLTMIMFPVVQIITIIAVTSWGSVQAARGELEPAFPGVWPLLTGLGLVLSCTLLIVAMALSGALRDLRHVWALPIWPIYSTAISFTMLAALRLELTRRPQVWNKPHRTGVISHQEATSLSPVPATPDRARG